MNIENIIPAVDKTIALLEYLGQTENGRSQAELAKELDITGSTCYRILQTLLKHDWLLKLPENRYDLSSGMLSAVIKLTDQTARFESAVPLLEKLSAQTGLSCKLSIRQGNQQVTILRAESPRPMSVSGKVGSRFPIIEGSVGAVLLSGESEETVRKLATTCREDIVEKSQPEIIFDRIQSLGKQGYCLNTKYNRWKVDAMSVPVVNSGKHVVAALTLLGFDDDFYCDVLGKLAQQLKTTAAQCSRIS